MEFMEYMEFALSERPLGAPGAPGTEFRVLHG